MWLASIALAYLGWAVVYVSPLVRREVSVFKKLSIATRMMRIVGLVLMSLALWPCISWLGVERGIAAWLTILTFSGGIFIFTTQTHARANQYMVIAALGLFPVGLLAGSIGG